MSMAAEQRKLLEQLMGADALNPKQSRQRESVNLYDSSICKSYLVDFCIHDLFPNTKKDLGPCRQKHLEKYKLEYIAQKNRGKEFPEFEEEFERTLRSFIRECDMYIKEATAKLEKTPEDLAKLNRETKALEEIDTSINLTLKEVGVLGKKGEVNRAFYEQDLLRMKRVAKEAKENDIRQLSEVSGFSGHQRLQVCQECGAYLSRLDNDKRLADHFLGKMHKGYVQIRAAYQDISKKNEERRRRYNEEKRKRSLRY